MADAPRFLLTSAFHWDSVQILETWNYRWGCEVFHELVKQMTGFESSQVRKEEAVQRHFRLSCVAHSLLNDVSCEPSCEDVSSANGKSTVGKQVRAVASEALHALLKCAQILFEQGRSSQQVLDVLMPA